MTSRHTSRKWGTVFEEDDVVHLLSAAIEREGGQSAFAKRHGLDRSGVNMILHRKKRVNDPVAAALRASQGVRRQVTQAIVYTAEIVRRLLMSARSCLLISQS
jgi:hypothetical protein